MSEKSDGNEPNMEKIQIALAPFMWHKLLQELEHLLCIVNRDRTDLVMVYEEIASQLAGRSVRVDFTAQEAKLDER